MLIMVYCSSAAETVPKIMKKFNKDLAKRFANTYKVSDSDINKFC